MGDKLQSVALLFGAYDAKLHAGGRDARSRVEKLRDALGSSQYLAGKDVYVDGYAYFNRLEEDILSIILRQAHQVTVTLLGEKGNQELFQNALRQRERLVRMAREVGVPCEICWFTAQERTALDRLERCFFGSDEVWPEPTEQIEGCAFSPRCPNCMEICKHKKPGITHIDEEHYVRCFLYEKEEGEADD